jgi:Transposase IS66 family
MRASGLAIGQTRAKPLAGEHCVALMRDGYAGYAHLPAVHAWCAAHLLRDLRALSDADPLGQPWAQAMANTLLEANQAAHHARAAGADQLDQVVLTQIRNHYLGALAKGRTDNHGHRGTLATQARGLIRRFTRYQDMILRFAVDLTVPFTNNCAERAVRPVKVQQRTSGGAWRTLQATNSTPSNNSSPPAPGYHQSSPQLNSYHQTTPRNQPNRRAADKSAA